MTQYEYIKSDMKDVVFFVRVTTMELDYLREIYKHKTSWTDLSFGRAAIVGNIGQIEPLKEAYRPVALMFWYSMIDGRKICFYEVTSRYTDNEMIIDFIKQYCNEFNIVYNKTIPAITDAQNFHNVLQHIYKLNDEVTQTKIKHIHDHVNNCNNDLTVNLFKSLLSEYDVTIKRMTEAYREVRNATYEQEVIKADNIRNKLVEMFSKAIK